MRVTKIKATNFKGRSFEQELAPVTLLYGDNFAGKSARVESMQVALSGTVPGLVKSGSPKPSDVFHAFSSGPVMAAGADWDGGQVMRSYDGRNGSVKLKETGGQVVPPILFSLGQFTDKSGPERVRFLFGLSGTMPGAGAGAVAAIKLICSKVTEATLAADPGKAVATAAAAIVARLGRSWTDGGARPFNEWLEDLVGSMRDDKREADGNVKRLQGAIIQNAAPVNTPAPAGAEQRLADAVVKLGEHERSVAGLLERFNRADEDLCKARDAASQAAEEAKAALKDAKAELKRHEALEPEDISSGIASAREARRHIGEELNKSVQSEQAASLKVVEASAALKAVSGCKCPTCGHERAADPKAVKEAKVWMALATRAREEVTDHRNKLEEELQAANEALERSEGHQQKRTTWLERKNKLADEVLLAQRRADRFKGIVTDAEMIELEKASIAARQELETAESRLPQLKDAVAKADVDAKQKVAWDLEREQMRRASEELTRCEGEAVAYREACKVLAAEQQRLVDEAIGPILERANALCSKVLGAELALIDGRDFALNRGGKLVPCRRPTCSGTEEALSGMALAVALAADSPCRIVMLDELGRLDDKNKAVLVTELRDLVRRGDIDQAILVDVRPIQPERGLKDAWFSQVEVLP